MNKLLAGGVAAGGLVSAGAAGAWYYSNEMNHREAMVTEAESTVACVGLMPPSQEQITIIELSDSQSDCIAKIGELTTAAIRPALVAYPDGRGAATPGLRVFQEDNASLRRIADQRLSDKVEYLQTFEDTADEWILRGKQVGGGILGLCGISWLGLRKRRSHDNRPFVSDAPSQTGQENREPKKRFKRTRRIFGTGAEYLGVKTPTVENSEDDISDDEQELVRH